jgi:protein dithiol:quinone oxidoreductase
MAGLSSRTLLIGTALTGVAAVAAALVSQHVFGMEPCPWCVLQRVIFLAISLAALIGLLLQRVIGAGLAIVLAACGVAAALWQHFVAAATNSCNMTFADRIVGGMKLDSLVPDVFSPRASCADAAVKLLGVSYEFWSLALFVLLGAAMLQVLRSRR